jgi:hypothetical protein
MATYSSGTAVKDRVEMQLKLPLLLVELCGSRKGLKRCRLFERGWDDNIFLARIYSALNLVCGKETSDFSGVRLSRHNDRAT